MNAGIIIEMEGMHDRACTVVEASMMVRKLYSLFVIMIKHAIQWNTVQNNIKHYNTIQCNTIEQKIIRNDIIRYITMQYDTTKYST